MPKPRRRLFTECLEARDVPNASIAGSTFEDANLDGFYAQVVAAYVGAPPTENPIAGVTVELDLGGDGTYERTTTTDAAGEYRFTDVPRWCSRDRHDTGRIHRGTNGVCGFAGRGTAAVSGSVADGKTVVRTRPYFNSYACGFAPGLNST